MCLASFFPRDPMLSKVRVGDPAGAPPGAEPADSWVVVSRGLEIPAAPMVIGCPCPTMDSGNGSRD